MPEHEIPTQTPWEKDVPTDYYLYFEYAKKTVNKKLSAAPRAALLEEMRLGGRVTGIVAHTSPEGSHEAQGKQWQGNTKLAEERAEAAEAWVREVIAEAGAGSIETKAKAEPAEEPELYTLRDETGKDIEGRKLEQHVGGDVRHLRRGGAAPRRRSTRSSRRARRAAAAAPRPSTSGCAGPTSRSRAPDRGVTPGVKKVPGTWRDAPVACNPVTDAEIAKRYPQFDLQLSMSDTPYTGSALRRDALPLGRLRQPRPPRPRPHRVRGQRHEPAARLRDEGARRVRQRPGGALRRRSRARAPSSSARSASASRARPRVAPSASRPGTSRILASGPDGMRVLIIGGVPGQAYVAPEWSSGEASARARGTRGWASARSRAPRGS